MKLFLGFPFPARWWSAGLTGHCIHLSQMGYRLPETSHVLLLVLQLLFQLVRNGSQTDSRRNVI